MNASWELQLDDDGTFRYEEEGAHPEYSIGADASGRWTQNGATIAFAVTKSNFGFGEAASLVGRTGSGTLAGETITLDDVTLTLVAPSPR